VGPCPEAFEGIISVEQFLQAQEILERRRRRYDPDYMLRQLHALYETHGVWRPSLLRLDEQTPSAGAYARQFGSLDFAFQNLFNEQRERARENVQEQIGRQVSDVLPYGDFLVLDRKLTVSIQPAVPIPHGDTHYWPFCPDQRRVIDLTLGVILSAPEECQILGYVALPRWLADRNAFRLTSSSARAELFGRLDLAFLQQLLA
jgi:hypothetical protein